MLLCQSAPLTSWSLHSALILQRPALWCANGASVQLRPAQQQDPCKAVLLYYMSGSVACKSQTSQWGHTGLSSLAQWTCQLPKNHIALLWLLLCLRAASFRAPLTSSLLEG